MRSFREQGVGWQMENGAIAVRGSEAFALATRDAVDTMRDAGTPTAANEVHEALTGHCQENGLLDRRGSA
jgi:hypothetical protein